MGFQSALEGSTSSADLRGFTEWVATHYHVLAEGRGSFTMILEHVGDDERKAFDEFFRLLPEFLRDDEQWGWDGILARFCKVQDECMEAFRNELEKNED